MTSEDWQGINFKDSSPTINNPTFNFGSSEPISQSNPPNNILKGSANFVGRQYELTTLHKKLQQPGAVAISAVAGMGGVGKTELAIRYARQHEADYPGGICWLSARESNLAAKILQYAQLYMNLEVPQELGGRLLNLKEQIEWCWRNWQPSEGMVLVVFDDVTNWENCREVLPTTSRFCVLFTTRLRNIDPRLVKEISLDVLSKENALALLTAFAGESRVVGEGNVSQLLCEWLGYLPLGLELVGRYLAEDPNLSLSQMMKRLSAERLQDEAINFAQQGVQAAFELSWQDLDPTTQRIGKLLSLFAGDVILWELVEFISHRLCWAATDVNKAKKQLYKHHLIQYWEKKEGYYKIHPLIREFLQVKLTASEQVDDFKKAFATAIVAIAQKIPSFPTRELIESVKDAIPHLAEVAQNLTVAVSDFDLIWVFVGLIRFYEGQGLYTLAERWHKQCLSVVQERLGEAHPDVTASLNNLAGLYRAQGRYTEAEPLYQKALSLRQRLLGEEHPYVSIGLNNLALLYYFQGRYEEAELLYQKALKLWQQRLLGEEHPYVAACLNNLALLYRAQGRYREAEPLCKKALQLRRWLLGEEHPSVATSLNNLAELYESQGRYTEAESLYKKALLLRQRWLVEEHPDVVSSLNNLAALYRSLRRYAEAELLYQQALEIASKSLGLIHPSTITIRENLKFLHDNRQSWLVKVVPFVKRFFRNRGN